MYYKGYLIDVIGNDFLVFKSGKVCFDGTSSSPNGAKTKAKRLVNMVVRGN